MNTWDLHDLVIQVYDFRIQVNKLEMSETFSFIPEKPSHCQAAEQEVLCKKEWGLVSSLGQGLSHAIFQSGLLPPDL